MPRQTRRSWWGFVVALLLGTIVVLCTGPVEAKRGHAYRSYRHHHIHRSHHSHHHHHHSLHYLFGFSPFPYDPFWPHWYPYWPYYWPYEAYGGAPRYYAEGEHRRFPAFRMPAFFRYPGAIAKGEDVAGQKGSRADDTKRDGRRGP